MSIQQISIPKPCHEQWQQMMPANGGRYCDHCCKTVTDFTVMSNDQIIKLLSAKDNVCGRFGQMQMTEINAAIGASKKRSVSLIGILTVAIISLTQLEKAEAKTRHNLEQGGFQHKSNLRIPVSTGGQILVKGLVTEKGSNIPIPGATVRCKNGESTSTGVDGEFKFLQLSETDTLVVSFIGFKTQEIRLADIADRSQIKIELEPELLTEQFVVGGAFVHHSFVHRLWHKIKNIF
ncbi:carboxypeptidase-like regulatory domain-containing protein [Mucilaginibacter sp.]|uniref:carboxypeptidase-like regulatory domain-containing protein n=1 Tax=Mucilaginibacter sp. TaxID=1882438 RepID=UPI002ED13CB8